MGSGTPSGKPLPSPLPTELDGTQAPPGPWVEVGFLSDELKCWQPLTPEQSSLPTAALCDSFTPPGGPSAQVPDVLSLFTRELPNHPAGLFSDPRGL